MHKVDTKTPSSFLALTVGIFIGAMFVLPMFAYMCRVNGRLRQENQRWRAQLVHEQLHKRPPQCYPDPSLLEKWHYENRPGIVVDHILVR